MKAPIALAAISFMAGCDRRAPITSCNQDLTGAYAEGDKRWMVLDHKVTLEVYPLFPDVPQSGLEVAPRVIDLVRDAPASRQASKYPWGGTAIDGHVKRRYMRGTAMCTARIPVRVTACAGDALEVVLADPVPPLQFLGPWTIEVEPPAAESLQTIELFGVVFARPLCKFPRPDSNRREHWQRE